MTGRIRWNRASAEKVSALSVLTADRQWRRYTRASQIKWPGWRSIALAPPCLLLCFGKVWIKMSSYLTALLVLFWHWNNQRRWRPVFWGRWLKNSFEEVHPRVTWLEDILTSKWPGSFTALAFAPDDLPHDLSDLEMTWLPWCPGAATADRRQWEELTALECSLESKIKLTAFVISQLARGCLLYGRRSCVARGSKSPLEQSAALRHKTQEWPWMHEIATRRCDSVRFAPNVWDLTGLRSASARALQLSPSGRENGPVKKAQWRH